MIQKLTILGATGSIGVSTLDVVARHPGKFEVLALSAHRQSNKLFEQCQQFHPRFAVVGDAQTAGDLQVRLREQGLSTEVLVGVQGLEYIAQLSEVDTVVAAIVGAAGLRPTLAAVKAGKKILLANKESLVMAGAFFMAEVAQSGAILLPIDSEHNAIFQSLPQNFTRRRAGEFGIRRILLTASGGPFRQLDVAHLPRVTPKEACSHPNWVMGPKISVDSATMMNKGLELIEAYYLFGVSLDKIEIVIHPQSVIHSMVEYEDGSVIAQLGNPDMRTPIAHALAYPERIASGVPALDLFSMGALTFERPDFERFPCLKLAYQAISQGGTTPAILNAANEIAVSAFLENRLAFDRIAMVIEATLNQVEPVPENSLDDIFAADDAARVCARAMVPAPRIELGTF